MRDNTEDISTHLDCKSSAENLAVLYNIIVVELMFMQRGGH